MKKTKKILIIRLGAIGDVVFTTIMPYSIKLKHPDYEIHYLVQGGIGELLQNNQYIDKIYQLDRQKQKSFVYMFNLARELYKEKYDIIFNLNNTIKSNFLSIFSMPSKIIHKKKSKAHWVDDFFYTAKKVFPDIINPNRLYLGIEENLDKSLCDFLNNYPKPHVFIAPGGATDKNRAGRTWKIEYWQDLNDKILNKYGGTIFVCGNKQELDAHKVLERPGVIILTGKYSLKESSALFSHADIFISGDTGPIHIASAHNIKTLALLGSTSPDKIKPYGENGYWISSEFECKFCWNKQCKFLNTRGGFTPCMENLKPDAVLKKIETILK